MSRRRWSPRRWPLWVQLAISFALVTALALGGGGALLLRQMKARQMDDRSRSLLAQANAAANLAGEFWPSGDTSALTLSFQRFQHQTGVRPVAVNRQGTVVADSWSPSPLMGQRLSQPEVKAALTGEQVTGVRWLGAADGWVMYGAVPVYQKKAPVGAVLVSTDINGLEEGMVALRRQLLVVALVAEAIAIALGAALAPTLVRPLARLSAAAATLAHGRLETRVDLEGSREVEELGQSFNAMAVELGRLDRQRRAFVADASHELRTPVASIRALAEGLLANRSDGCQGYREYLEDIVHDCDRAGRLVEGLLELARLDVRREGRGPARVEQEVDLFDLAGEVVQALGPLARERAVRLSLTGEPGLRRRLDPRLVETILGNLVENALKYTPAGGEARVAVEPGDPAQISVTDTGPGIASEHLPHLFERFYRVDKARSRATGGAGLGLAIAAESAALLGGRIEVDSAPGQGSRFTLLIPK